MNKQEKIRKLKEEKNILILAHYYTIQEVQEVADFVGDSLALSKSAASTSCNMILFAGVHFMAETAKILNPHKKVLIPDLSASCSLADSCKADDFAHFLQNYPHHTILSYINCSAEIKAMSDIIVTSGNALNIVRSLPEDEKIVFAPDKNLGNYIQQQTGKKMVLWNGVCHVHDQLNSDQIFAMKKQNPKSQVIAHPECQGPVLALADFVGSTAAMLTYVKKSSHSSFIVATETGILYEMKKQNPEKQFHVVNALESCSCNDCEYMKKNTLDNILQALETEQPELQLDENLIRKALLPIKKMLSL